MVSRVSPAGNQVDRTVAPVSFANGVQGGWIGYVEKTDIQGPGFTSETQITMNAALTVTVNTSRRIWLGAYIIGAGSTSGDLWAVFLKEGSTQLQADRQVNGIADSTVSSMTFHPQVILTPSAGSHSYTATMIRSSGTGNATVRGSSTQPNWLMAVDLGPA